MNAVKMSSSGPSELDAFRVSDHTGYTRLEPPAVEAAMLE
jgi:hypothetical protein